MTLISLDCPPGQADLSDLRPSDSLASGGGVCPFRLRLREAAHGKGVPLPRESARGAVAAARPESARPMTTHLASGAAWLGRADAGEELKFG
jgi:hypothetical protein